MSRRSLLLVLATFVVTRLITAWLADNPDRYASQGTVVTGDPERYGQWAVGLVDEGRGPYSEVPIEYPPGALPFISGPLALARGGSYRTAFIATMLLVDVVGLLGLIRLARRRASTTGLWLWVVLVPLVGPLAYVRLDLVPAVATIWAVERAVAGSSFGAGCWLGYGILVKLYPALLLPAAWVGWGRRGRLLGGVAILVLVPLVPLVGSLPDLWDAVIGYHSGRGLQIESTWAVLLLASSRFGGEVSIAFNFGAFHVGAGVAPLLEGLATLLSVSAVVVVPALLWRAGEPHSHARVASALFAALALFLSVASVFSPQFLLWLVALLAAWASLDPGGALRPGLLLGASALLTQAVYPFLYTRLLSAHWPAIAALLARNALVAGAGSVALAGLFRAGRGAAALGPGTVEPSPETPARPAG